MAAGQRRWGFLGLVKLMTLVSIKSTELLDIFSNPTHPHIDLSRVPAQTNVDNLIVIA